MRVAIISDIHGNLTALQAVQPALGSEADRVVCLGDVAATGPQPHETVALLKKLGYPCVMGNADESLLNEGPKHTHPRAGVPEEEMRRLEALDRWTSLRITESDRKYLSTFKARIRVRVGKSSLLCYHGSPNSNTEGILPTTSDNELSSMLSHTDATVFAGGHTHSQMVRRWRGSTVINPGSVGLPFETSVSGRMRNPAWAEYAVVTFENDKLRVELRRVRYSLTSLAEAVRRSGMPDPGWWLADWV